MSTNDLTAIEKSRYRRQITLNEVGLEGQERLKAAKVLCIGVGGLGSVASLYLAAGGVGNIGLIDGDTVSLDNLPRQILYRDSDVGAKKVDIAKKRLLEANPNVTITTYPTMINEENVEEILSSYDIILDGSDNFACKYLVSDGCQRLDKVNIFASIHKFQGQLAVFPGRGGPCYRCWFPLDSEANVMQNCQDAGVLNTTVGIIGSLQANEAIKCIVGLQTLRGHVMLIDLIKNAFRRFKLDAHSECGSCGHHDASSPASRPKVPSVTCDQENISISPEEFLKIKDTAKPYCIDVREVSEYQHQNAGFHNIPLATLPDAAKALDKNQIIIVSCQAGKRSLMACSKLREMGFQQVFSLEGGLNALLPYIEKA